MYKKICIPLMQINSNIYAFLSGILVSLSTNIFSTLCFAPIDFVHQWHHYLSTLLLVVSGALCMHISVKVSPFQSYISNNQISKQEEIRETIEDITEKRKSVWVTCYSLLIVSTLAGFVFLSLSWLIRDTPPKIKSPETAPMNAVYYIITSVPTLPSDCVITAGATYGAKPDFLLFSASLPQCYANPASIFPAPCVTSSYATTRGKAAGNK